ncbi:uncharacterized protein V6R79_005323 [Siganus canaliculatus]
MEKSSESHWRCGFCSNRRESQLLSNYWNGATSNDQRILNLERSDQIHVRTCGTLSMTTLADSRNVTQKGGDEEEILELDYGEDDDDVTLELLISEDEEEDNVFITPAQSEHPL